MEGPSFLPQELEYCTLLDSDEELGAALANNPADLVRFFEIACEDEGWFEEHPRLVRILLRWAAKNFFLYKFPSYLAKRMARTIRLHHSFLRPFLIFRPALFFTVRLTVEKEPVLVNAFLFGAGSSYFYHFFRTQCFDKTSDCAILPGLSLVHFRLIEEYLLKGTIDYLWKLEQNQIIELMHISRSLAISGLVGDCASVLRRYIDKDNVIDTLLNAYRQSFREWMTDAAHVFNEQGWGIRIVPEELSGLKIEFFDYKQETLDRFNDLAPLVTHLAFGGHLSEESFYKDIISKCPNLIGLDLCNAARYANQFEGITQDIQDLDLSACAWLNPQYLREIGSRFPNIRFLNLSNNVQLNYLCWSELSGFKKLRILHVSRCNRMTDEDLKIISRSCPYLEEWNGEESHGFTDRGLLEIIHQCRQLRTLCINRCTQLTDKILFELGAVGTVTSLSIMRCPFSEKALLHFLELSRGMKFLNIKQCNISDKTIEQIRTLYPSQEVLA